MSLTNDPELMNDLLSKTLLL